MEITDEQKSNSQQSITSRFLLLSSHKKKWNPPRNETPSKTNLKPWNYMSTQSNPSSFTWIFHGLESSQHLKNALCRSRIVSTSPKKATSGLRWALAYVFLIFNGWRCTDFGIFETTNGWFLWRFGILAPMPLGMRLRSWVWFFLPRSVGADISRSTGE